MTSIVAVGFGARAIDESKSATAGDAAAAVTTVRLSEFAITPASVETAGGTLRVVNTGSVPHDLAIEGTDLMTPTLDPGGSAELSLASLAPGSYTMVCHVPGHAQAGMRAQLVVTAGGGAPATSGAAEASGRSPGHAMAHEVMDEAMAATTKAFPAQTEGQGGQVLAPTVLADGTKQFELRASVVKWEVEPGRFVDAWTYNGTVPGPTLEVADGERVRRAPGGLRRRPPPAA